ncbi:MAG: polysulfide reductase NrfD [Dehalococcoidales bacterium]|jgi:formate-dependent nitrite reductase membrane component NrfD|nr:polysulfide reductase NrfD [Dehalococcoidales bacterium]
MATHTSRQWMVTHEWMLKGNRQSEWIEKRGILLWLAFYCGGLGGGLYLVSLFFNNLWGMIAGWVIVAVLKGSFHFAFLGKPARFWRMVFHPQTSWLSRGLLFVLSFTGAAFIQIILSLTLPGSPLEILFKVVAGVFALAVATYTGFVLNKVKGVPFWNLPILPVLFVIGGILGGFGLTVGMGIFNAQINLHTAENWSRVFLIIDVLLISIYLALAARKDETGKKSVLYQLKGGLAVIFWSGVVLAGAILPFVITFYSYFAGDAAPGLIITAVICEIAGGMLLRYCLLKSAIYSPLISLRA